jgi:hypothetical protein
LGQGVADQGVITYLDGTVAAAPGTPAAGKLRLYAKTGKVLAVKDDAGVETVLGAAGGSSLTSVSAQLGSGASVGLNTSTYTDILSLGSCAAGTWLFMCSIYLQNASTAGVVIKIWDGTTLYASADTVLVAGNPQRNNLVAMAIVVLGGSATVKVSGLTVVTTASALGTTVTGSVDKASNLVGIKIA